VKLHSRVAGVPQEAQRLACTREPLEVLGSGDVLGSRGAPVEDPVAIEDDGGATGEEALGHRQALERADAVIAVVGDERRQLAPLGEPATEERMIDLVVDANERARRDGAPTGAPAVRPRPA
jgi:hypothetical protein